MTLEETRRKTRGETSRETSRMCLLNTEQSMTASLPCPVVMVDWRLSNTNAGVLCGDFEGEQCASVGQWWATRGSMRVYD